MNAQLKKGVLELIVLESVRQKDMYGYELVEEVSKVVDVNEGTIYPLLKRMTNEHYYETYLRETGTGYSEGGSKLSEFLCKSGKKSRRLLPQLCRKENWRKGIWRGNHGG